LQDGFQVGQIGCRVVNDKRFVGHHVGFSLGV